MYQKYSFENLEIYQLSMQLIKEIYSISKKFPKTEAFCLTSQIRRAVISIALNITEGSGRNSKKDFARFINQSIGSLLETKTCLIIAKDLKYITQKEMQEAIIKIDEIYFKSLNFRKYLQK